MEQQATAVLMGVLKAIKRDRFVLCGAHIGRSRYLEKYP